LHSGTSKINYIYFWMIGTGYFDWSIKHINYEIFNLLIRGYWINNVHKCGIFSNLNILLQLLNWKIIMLLVYYIKFLLNDLLFNFFAFNYIVGVYILWSLASFISSKTKLLRYIIYIMVFLSLLEPSLSILKTNFSYLNIRFNAYLTLWWLIKQPN